jgi:hypothetical protein
MNDLTTKMALAALNARDYQEIEDLLDSTFSDYIDDCGMDETNCVNEDDFATWFYDLVKDRLPNANMVAIKHLARSHADSYNNQDQTLSH